MRADAGGLSIAGLTPFSTVDWPGQMTATLFLQGCPWDCFYCHNPALIDPRTPGAVTWDEVTDLLDGRVGLLDGVVFSGGEPTRQPGVAAAMAEVRARGFGVGLHTAGAYPGLLAPLLELVDWIGLDIKATREDYAGVTGRPPSGERAWASLELVLAAVAARRDTGRPLDYEVRTTVHPAAFDDDTLIDLGCRLADAGVDAWAVQRFRETGTRQPLPRIRQSQTETRTDAALTLTGLPTERFASFSVR